MIILKKHLRKDAFYQVYVLKTYLTACQVCVLPIKENPT